MAKKKKKLTKRQRRAAQIDPETRERRFIRNEWIDASGRVRTGKLIEELRAGRCKLAAHPGEGKGLVKILIGREVKHLSASGVDPIDVENFCRGIELEEIELRAEGEDLRVSAFRAIDQHPDTPKTLRYLNESIGAKRKKTEHEETVDFYMSLLEGIRKATGRTVIGGTPAERETQEQAVRLMWARLANARIIDLGAEVYSTLHHEADVWTEENIGGVAWQPFDERNPEMTEEEQERNVKVQEAIHQVGKTMPLDVEHLPFEHVFFMFGAGDMAFQGMNAFIRYGLECNAVLGGVLVSHDGWVFDIGVIQLADGGGQRISHTVLRDGVEWVRPVNTLMPWIAPALIELVNENRAIVENHDGRRLALGKKKIGVKRPIPQPYYTVYLKSTVVRESWQRNRKLELGRKRFEFQHRFDVRGHERCYVRRGDMPLDRKKRTGLVEGGYTVYTVDSPTGEDERRLNERGMPTKRAGEWLAIKTRWIDADVRPHNNALPYVPAVRRKPKSKRAS